MRLMKRSGVFTNLELCELSHELGHTHTHTHRRNQRSLYSQPALILLWAFCLLWAQQLSFSLCVCECVPITFPSLGLAVIGLCFHRAAGWVLNKWYLLRAAQAIKEGGVCLSVCMCSRIFLFFFARGGCCPGSYAIKITHYQTDMQSGRLLLSVTSKKKKKSFDLSALWPDGFLKRQKNLS